MDTRAATDRLIVFAKYPEPGRVKTRMIPALGPEEAAQLHFAMARRTLHTVSRFSSNSHTDIEVRFAGGEGQDTRLFFGSEFRLAIQSGSDLGERLDRAVREAFRSGMKRVLVIGTDCPDITPDLLEESLKHLDTADVVLGPARDGGYYLIGMNCYRPELFGAIAWGSERVLEQTLQAAARSELRVHQLKSLADVDYPEDLIVWRRATAGSDDGPLVTRPGTISVIVPTLNEAACLDDALRPLAEEPNTELIVADGGSCDGTVEIASRYCQRVVRTARGRARQMNAGAGVATGEMLIFLHADTRLPPGFRRELQETLRGDCVAGAFRLQIRSEGGLLRWVERCANLRSRLLQMPYGDQSLFLSAGLFYEVGGFADLPLMEDFELCRRLRRYGSIRLAPSAASTSARRWRKLGVLRTTLINQLCVAGYLLGIEPLRLARLYRGNASAPPYDEPKDASKLSVR